MSRYVARATIEQRRS